MYFNKICKSGRTAIIHIRPLILNLIGWKIGDHIIIEASENQLIIKRIQGVS